MLYLLDANVLIDANGKYYNMERVREFWEWLAHVAREGKVKIPIEIYEEITKGTDELATWAKRSSNRDDLILKEDVDEALLRRVIDEGYALNLLDVDIGKLGRDPFLIAYALSNYSDRIIVTNEISKPNLKAANKHVPDVCNFLGIKWCDAIQFFEDMDFRTDWETNP